MVHQIDKKMSNMKYCRLALLITLTCNVFCLKAQDEDPNKVIFDLRKEVANKDARKDLDACLANTEQAVDKKAQESQAQILQLTQQHANDSTTIESLKQELANLTSFRKLWLTQMAESVNEKWLIKPYSEINLSELEGAVKQYEEFASDDERIADACTKLKSLQAECQLYAQGVEAIDSPYDANRVKSLATSIKNLRDSANDKGKKDELSSLLWKLDNYGTAIKLFKDVIKAVDKQIEGRTNKDNALPLVQAVLKKDEGKITDIKKFPWLAKQYDLYYKDLETNCVAPSAVHDCIMNLNP